jgi:hypothetical protein
VRPIVCLLAAACGSTASNPEPTACLAPGVATVCDSCAITLEWSELEAERDGEPVAPTDVDGATLLVAAYPVDQVECTLELEQADVLEYRELGYDGTALVLDATWLYPPPDTNLVLLLVGGEVVQGTVLVPDPEADTAGLSLR